MTRDTRYQALIVKDGAVLLIKHCVHESGRGYWVIPGGGLEGAESETDCVIREAREETNLEVEVDCLLLDETRQPGSVYRRVKTYLCHPVSGEPSPGYEPEADAAAVYAITDVRWFDLRVEKDWPHELVSSPFTYTQLRQAREKLGYLSSDLQAE